MARIKTSSTRAIRSYIAVKVAWPAWRYGPNGEAEIFEDEGLVPHGWRDRPFEDWEVAPPEAKAGLNKQELRARLKELGIKPDPLWPSSKMLELIDKIEKDS